MPGLPQASWQEAHLLSYLSLTGSVSFGHLGQAVSARRLLRVAAVVRGDLGSYLMTMFL